MAYRPTTPPTACVRPQKPVSTGAEDDLRPGIPTIDLARFRTGSPEQRREVAVDLDRACTDVGFLQVVGHDIPAGTETGLLEAIDGFFSLPMWQKKALLTGATDLNRGYTPPRSDRLALGPTAPRASGELFEAFQVGRSAEDFPGLGLDEVAYPPNLWPLRPVSFEPAVQAWFGEAARVAREVTTLMALALGLSERFFTGFQDHSLDVLRLNNYRVPADPTWLEPGQVGLDAHTDQGLVTVLWSDPIAGLQFEVDGVWRDVIPAPGTLLVNPGDLMARWTNDRWRSTRHRVLPPTDSRGQLVRRRSAAFFHDGNADAVISVLPGCATPEHPLRYDSVTVSDYLAGNFQDAPAPVAATLAGHRSVDRLSATAPAGC